MGFYEEADPGNPFNALRKCGLLVSDPIPYGTFRLMLREYEIIAFKINRISFSA